jgi:hypothetical protein
MTGPKATDEGFTQLSPASVVVGVGDPVRDFVGVAFGEPFGNGELVGDFVGDGDACGCAVGVREAVPDGGGVGNVPGKEIVKINSALRCVIASEARIV